MVVVSMEKQASEEVAQSAKAAAINSTSCVVSANLGCLRVKEQVLRHMYLLYA